MPRNLKTIQAAKLSALTVSLGLSLSLNLSALADGEATLKNVTVDANRQLVIQFAPGAAPSQPRIIEVKEPNHQLRIEFTNVALDENAPASDKLSKFLQARMPGVRSARVGNLANGNEPTVLVQLDLDPDLAIKPELTSISPQAAVVSFGDDYVGAPAAAAAGEAQADAPATALSGGGAAAPATAAAGNDATAAYEEYYRKFLQQKELVKKEAPVGEWGPRKGTAAEAMAIKKKGVKIIATPPEVTTVDLPAAGVSKARASARTAPVAEAAPDMSDIDMAQAEAAEQAKLQAKKAKEDARARALRQKAIAADPAVSPEEVASQNAETQMQPDMVPDAPASAAATPAPKPRAKPKVVEATPEETAAEPEMAGDSASEGDEGGPGETPRKRAIRVYNEAHKNHLAGRVDQAMAQYRQAIKIDPSLVEAHSDLGLAYNQQHNYGMAINEFLKALRLNPNDAYTYNGYGAALRAQHDNEAAIKNWQKAVRLDPRMAAAHYNLGTAYEAEGEFDRALVSYDDAVKNDQRFGEAYFRMGLIQQQRHRYAEARINFKKALKISADSDYAAEARTRIANLDRLIK